MLLCESNARELDSLPSKLISILQLPYKARARHRSPVRAAICKALLTKARQLSQTVSLFVHILMNIFFELASLFRIRLDAYHFQDVVKAARRSTFSFEREVQRA